VIEWQRDKKVKHVAAACRTLSPATCGLQSFRATKKDLPASGHPKAG